MVAPREDNSDSTPDLLAKLEALRIENAALSESHERLRFAIEGASDGLWYWDIPSGEEWWSDSLRELLGYQETDLEASFESWVSLLHPNERDDVLRVLERHLKEGEPYSIEYRLRTKNGGYRWFLARGRCERDADGKPKRMAGSVHDVTERKKAEHGLRLSSEIIEHMAEGVILTRMNDSVIVYANPRSEKIYGYDYGELAGQHVTILNASSQQDPQEVARAIMQTVEEEGSWSGEVHNVKKDGTEFWIRANTTTFEHREYGLVGLAVVQDITERKEAEQYLRLYAQILEHTAEGVSLVRQKDGVIVYANPRFEEIYGYDPGELINQHVSILNASSERPPEETAAEIIQAVETRGHWSGEIHNVKKDGSKIWSWANVTTFEHQEYGPVLIAVQEDVTKRVEATAALRESEHQLRRLLDTMIVYVGLCTPDGVLIDINQAPLNAASLTREEVLGKPFWETYWWSFSERAQTRLRDALQRAAAGESVRYDALVRVGESEDGKPVFLTIDGTFAPLYDSNGEVVQLVGSAVDISQRVQAEAERRKLETQIQHSQKLESLGILAGGIAHDFNNLLVAILGNASLVLEELPADSIIVEDVQDIELAAKRAAELCRELLAYAGKGNFVVKALNLNTLIEEMGQLLSVSISKWPTLNYDLAKSLPPIMVDATQLRQVVMNLITNASEAIGDNEGVITMKTGVIQCTQAQLAEYFSGDHLPNGDYVYLDVIDSGTGIKADDLPQLFDPFFTTKFTGRGLGLASVIGIIRGHAGALRVSSTPGKGAIFRVLFPCTESVETEIIQTPHDLEDWQSEGVVLVVDDDERVRTLAGRMLERVGFTVVFAKDGVEAVEIFESRQDEIRFVLLDLTMPRMRGEEAFEKIRAIRTDVPVLFSSGYTEEDVLDRLKSESRIMFVQKPYTVADLNKTVRKMFSLLDSR